MEMPRPTEAHRRLERLVGQWGGEEHMHPSPWDPAGGTALARNVRRRALDGFAVIGDYEQERDGVVNFRGHGVFTWDARDERYVLHWWDSMGMPPNVFVGSFEGDVLTMTSESHGGHTRMRYEFVGDAEMTSRMEMSPDGEHWSVWMEGRYSRQQ